MIDTVPWCMAVSISELRREYLFRAGLQVGSDSAAKRVFLIGLYEAVIAGGDAEAVAIGGEGSSSSWQFRGATPEDHRLALMEAIESLDGLIAGDTAAAFSRPFGFRFTNPPHTALDSA